MAIRVGVNGACGRMGIRIVDLVQADPDLELTAALDSKTCPAYGSDVGIVAGLGELGVEVTGKLADPVDVVIDFSIPDATLELLDTCLEQTIPIAIATTGFTDEQMIRLRAAGDHIPIIIAANMSLSVTLLLRLVSDAAAALKDVDADIEIIERHHRYKKDAPSGTALEFARAICESSGDKNYVYGREGLVGERPRDEIGLHSLRVGDNTGEHTVVFSMLGETMELVHKSSNRDSYAFGAIRAAKFLAAKSPGLYTMNHVLGLG